MSNNYSHQNVDSVIYHNHLNTNQISSPTFGYENYLNPVEYAPSNNRPTHQVLAVYDDFDTSSYHQPHVIKRNQSFNFNNSRGGGDKSAYFALNPNLNAFHNSSNYSFKNGLARGTTFNGYADLMQHLQRQQQHQKQQLQQQQFLLSKYFGNKSNGIETIGRHFLTSPLQNHFTASPSPTQIGGQFIESGINIRFAVNGISKFSKSGSVLPMNKNIQAGDFGDDAGMIAENSRCIVIGLADGAGGNRNIGIDPQKFSRSLLGYCVEIIKSESIMPTQMAKLACKSIHILESQQIDGSGTLCLLALDKQTNVVHALNIGDSGFRLIRHGGIVEKSKGTRLVLIKNQIP